jgi:hypothetical protein
MNQLAYELINRGNVTVIRNILLSKILDYDSETQYTAEENLRLHYLIDLYYIASRCIELYNLQALSRCVELYKEWMRHELLDRYTMI